MTDVQNQHSRLDEIGRTLRHAQATRRTETDSWLNGYQDDVAYLFEQYQAAREALEGVDVFYAEAIGLIGELREDAELVYVADKGLPPHIEKARDLTDHEETLAQARAVLYPAMRPES